MNTFKRFRNLFNNIIKFLAELSRYDRFYWRSSSCKAINCHIDKSVVVYGNYSLTNVKIDFASYVSQNANMSNTSVGKFCSIGPNLVCGWGIHPIDGISTHPAFYSTTKKSKITYSKVDQVAEQKAIVIGNDVFIGANVTILDGVSIGDGAVIGAGAVVSKDIPAYAVAVGCPVKIIKYRFSKDIIDELLMSRWWDKGEADYKDIVDCFYDVPSFLSNIEKRSKVFNL
ncbi:CatB-related O-acetyltransferase [Fibrivirga algicola]|uniref:CatB-related O-acetyltransferase n=1 Tax=Fibrivirga algicola TaxID=2950420 RepID=A0ABX0QJM5_9BACT|nr:CatB-related O-acetyltransferase [Fibrivirga algicola]NID12282.1 CatB-related O-acetyltransferase [Fibrivirga algicola]